MPKPSSATVLLMSAAETGWDATGRLLGQSAVAATDDALTRMHARMGELVGEIQTLDLVLCGPEDSCMASGSLMSEAFHCKLRSLDGLANVDLGLWEGTLREELEGRCPSTYKAWRDQPESIRPPEGESLNEALDRAGESIRRAVEKLKPKTNKANKDAQGQAQPGPRVGVVVRSMLWAGLLSRLDPQTRDAFWTHAGETGVDRVQTIRLADLTPDPASVSA